MAHHSDERNDEVSATSVERGWQWAILVAVMATMAMRVATHDDYEHDEDNGHAPDGCNHDEGDDSVMRIRMTTLTISVEKRLSGRHP